MALSLAIGVGVTVWPYAFIDLRASSYTANFWRCEDCSTAVKGLRNGVAIFLSTGYCVGTVIAILLNLILPQDAKVIKTGEDNYDETADVTTTVREEEIEMAKDPVKDYDSAEGGTSDEVDKNGNNQVDEDDDEIAV